MKNMQPMLFTTLKSYSKEQFAKDVLSGIIVAVIALPLSIALALASGVAPEQGIYTAIFAGFVIAFLGGSTVQISGPTAAFATIVAGIVVSHGMEGLTVATVLAGVFLLIMGFCRFGSLIRFIPYTITTGFTAGIALTIAIGQLKDFMGISYAAGLAPISTTEKLAALWQSFGSFNWQALLVGGVCLLIMLVWPRINKKLPPSLIAVIAGILMVKLLPLQVNTIGDLYTVSNSLPLPKLPHFSLELIGEVLPDALTIAVLAAIESLLSCVVADGMTNTKHHSNMELAAQGAGNIASAVFGGIPATGAIARTAANIKSGGKTPVSGMVHSLVLVLILVVLMPYAAWIPMPTIAAILFTIAYNMCQWRAFSRLIHTAPFGDVTVLLLTFLLTVFFDLVVAIEVGMVLACLLFMKQMSDKTGVVGWKYTDDANDPDSINLRKVPRHVRVYEITGPLFFGAAERLTGIAFKDYTKCLILRMRSVPTLDATALNALESLHKKCEAKNITLVFSHVNAQPMSVMKKAGFVAKVGEVNFCPHIDDAIARAQDLVESRTEVKSEPAAARTVLSA